MELKVLVFSKISTANLHCLQGFSSLEQHKWQKPWYHKVGGVCHLQGFTGRLNYFRKALLSSLPVPHSLLQGGPAKSCMAPGWTSMHISSTSRHRVDKPEFVPETTIKSQRSLAGPETMNNGNCKWQIANGNSLLYMHHQPIKFSA